MDVTATQSSTSRSHGRHRDRGCSQSFVKFGVRDPAMQCTLHIHILNPIVVRIVGSLCSTTLSKIDLQSGHAPKCDEYKFGSSAKIHWAVHVG